MKTYILRRLIQSLVVIFIVTVMVFMGMRMLPGDPLMLLYDTNQLESFSEEQIQKIRQEAGLDRPLVVQYFSWMGNVFRGDLGKSILYGTSVTDDIIRRLPITAYIGSIAFVLGLAVGIPLGAISAIRRNTWADTVVTTSANIGITIPIFWLGIMMIYLFSINLHWLPVMGYTSPFVNFSKSLKQIIMPVFCLAIFPVAAYARQVRSSMLEVLGQDYVRTAWSKGLRERVVISRHVLKNSLIPVVTLAGMSVGSIVGGSVLIEQVFNIPGMGRLAVDSLFTYDYAYVQGLTLIMTAVVVVANLLVDISYGWLDPRISYK